MKKIDYLLKFRRYSSLDTLERVYEHMRYNVVAEDEMAFLSAYDHRKAELIMGKIYDKIPASVWQYVN